MKYSGGKVDLLLRKGVFPYDRFDSFSKLNKASVKDKILLVEWFRYLWERFWTCKKIFENFQMKTFKDYHDLYLKTKILLLSDIFENFGKFAWKIMVLTHVNILQLHHLCEENRC